MIQPTALCNLDCGYCYVPDRQDAARLPMALLERLLGLVAKSRLLRSRERLRILWHAGEPLAAGIEYFRAAFGLVDRVLGARWRIRHSIQTNATLVTAEWARLLAAARVSVGVSIDGPASLHDANRKTRGGRGSHAAALAGLELLREAGLDPGVLAVLSAANIDQAESMFRFFVEHRFRQVAFNVEEIEGPHRESSLLPDGDLAKARARYRAFMDRMVALNAAAGWPLRIRELASLAGRIRQLRSGHVGDFDAPERRSGGILTMTRRGMLYSWSPELASGTSGEAGDSTLGDVTTIESLDRVLEGAKAREIQTRIDRGIALCRERCRYFGVCGGGSPGNKLYQLGTFEGTETLKCSLQIQELTRVLVKAFGAGAHT